MLVLDLLIRGLTAVYTTVRSIRPTKLFIENDLILTTCIKCDILSIPLGQRSPASSL